MMYFEVLDIPYVVDRPVDLLNLVTLRGFWTTGSTSSGVKSCSAMCRTFSSSQMKMALAIAVIPET
jgi:hypothetical protein